jgi:predicted TIM-barrel fold metal-dependent hydrolase
MAAFTKPDYPVIDSDGHVVEQPFDIVEFMDPPYNDPEPFQYGGFGVYSAAYLDGWPRIGGFGSPGKRDNPDVQAWSRFLDEAGLDLSVVYPTAGLGFGNIRNKDYATILARGYNNWLVEKFCKPEPRLKGVALIPIQDVGEAVKELRRATTELGLVGAMLPGVTGLNKSYGHRDFDPLWAEAQRLGVPLAFHGGPTRGMGFDFLERYIQVHTLEHPFAQLLQITSVVLEGVWDRFPNLKLIFLEAGCGWVPFMMDRMDEEWERRGSNWAPDVKRKPSEYFTSGNFYVTCEIEERTIPLLIDLIGDDCLLYASDYPHERSRDEFFVDLPELFERKDLSAITRRKMLYENPKRVYNLSA